jgi:hypothetical protein
MREVMKNRVIALQNTSRKISQLLVPRDSRFLKKSWKLTPATNRKAGAAKVTARSEKKGMIMAMWASTIKRTAIPRRMSTEDSLVVVDFLFNTIFPRVLSLMVSPLQFLFKYHG